jgi:ABC-type multidrug transport system fused ATPase/permease subunit
MSLWSAYRARWIVLLSLASIITLVLLIPRATAALENAPPQSGALNGSSSPKNEITLDKATYSTGSVIIVVVLLVILTIIFLLILTWSNRLEQSTYLGILYKETLEDIEYKRLLPELNEKWESLEYHRAVIRDQEWCKKNKKPEPNYGVFGPCWASMLIRQYLPTYERPSGSSSRSSGRQPYALRLASNSSIQGKPRSPASAEEGEYQRLVARQQQVIAKQQGLTPEELQNKIDDMDAEQAFKSEAEKWEEKVQSEAASRYETALEQAHKVAKERAGRAIKVDFSALRGKGSEFVLEFTTIVVIIFAAIVLGVLQELESNQIGTLLAAIAGYVLGRATTRTSSSTSELESKGSEQKEVPVQLGSGADVDRPTS